MGYQDDFYTKDNIVGYTGDIDNNPTVYFMTENDGQLTVGHITQKHDNKKNEGRETVKTYSTKEYSQKNEYCVVNKNGEAIILTDFNERNGTNYTKNDKEIKFDKEVYKIELVSVERFGKEKLPHISRNPFTPVEKGKAPKVLEGCLKKENEKLFCVENRIAEEKKIEREKKLNPGFDNDLTLEEILKYDFKKTTKIEPKKKPELPIVASKDMVQKRKTEKDTNKTELEFSLDDFMPKSKKETNKTQPEVSLDNFMPKSKKDTNKVQPEVSLDDFMPKSKKETNKTQPEVSLDAFMPKSKKETNKTQPEVSLDAFMPKSKNNPVTKVTRTAPNTRIQRDKTNNTRQRRNSSKGPSKQF